MLQEEILNCNDTLYSPHVHIGISDKDVQFYINHLALTCCCNSRRSAEKPTENRVDRKANFLLERKLHNRSSQLLECFG